MNDLELLALRWLRFEKNCPIAMRERTPRYCTGQPDVLGITKHRYLLEVEIKRSVSDFRANEDKRHVKNRDIYISKWPKQFWFCVPADLADRVMPLLPEYAGLLRAPRDDERPIIHCVKHAPVNQASERLTIKEAAKLAHCMANHILSAEQGIAELRNRMSYIAGNLWDPEYSI